MTERENRPPEKKLRAAHWLPVIVWMGLIFTASSFQLRFPPSGIFRFQDKLAHLFEFGVLGFLLARAAHLDFPGSRAHYWACIIGAALYGGFDELHQFFVPGRSVQWSDFAADAFGAFIFAWAWLAFKGEDLFTRRGPEVKSTTGDTRP
ncbi:MAG TPA: VanZ family protein [archaeon]|nr:VanZ family protein [archaeon]